jgi:hypothetical protein
MPIRQDLSLLLLLAQHLLVLLRRLLRLLLLHGFLRQLERNVDQLFTPQYAPAAAVLLLRFRHTAVLQRPAIAAHVFQRAPWMTPVFEHAARLALVFGGADTYSFGH